MVTWQPPPSVECLWNADIERESSYRLPYRRNICLTVTLGDEMFQNSSLSLAEVEREAWGEGAKQWQPEATSGQRQELRLMGH